MTPFVDDGDMRLYVGDCLDVLRQLPDESVDCCVTSPPYWGLRDYGTGDWDGGNPDCDHTTGRNARNDGDRNGVDGFGGNRNLEGHADMGALLFRDVCGKCGARRVDRQLGLEPTPDEYVQNMVAVFREVRRVLAPHGTCWVNLGDSYASSQASDARSSEERSRRSTLGPKRDGLGGQNAAHVARSFEPRKLEPGLKPKDLVGIPWRVAFALQADGWWLRSDIVWSKPNPMPESVTDRPTKSHEYLFLLTKHPRYWFDAEAVREPHANAEWTAAALEGRWTRSARNKNAPERNDAASVAEGVPYAARINPAGRNVRSVWEIATQPFPGAHFATFPEELARRCIVAGCPAWVCRTCGRPRERIVERERGYESNAGRAATRSGVVTLRDSGSPRTDVDTGGHDLRLGPTVRTQTLGWSECGCLEERAGAMDAPSAEPGDPAARSSKYRPGRVLDPFAGAGTVGLVARKHARHSVLIELSEQYARDILLPRLSQLSLLAELA